MNWTILEINSKWRQDWLSLLRLLTVDGLSLQMHNSWQLGSHSQVNRPVMISRWILTHYMVKCYRNSWTADLVEGKIQSQADWSNRHNSFSLASLCVSCLSVSIDAFGNYWREGKWIDCATCCQFLIKWVQCDSTLPRSRFQCFESTTCDHLQFNHSSCLWW